VEAFLDGVISREERDLRLLPIDRQIDSSQTLLTQTAPAASLNATTLVEAFGVLFEWKFWSREQKRSVLAALAPEIQVADYQVMAVGLCQGNLSNDSIRRGTGSWRRPA
jgi:hypothetical protein